MRFSAPGYGPAFGTWFHSIGNDYVAAGRVTGNTQWRHCEAYRAAIPAAASAIARCESRMNRFCNIRVNG